MIRSVINSIISIVAILGLGSCIGSSVEDQDKPVYVWEGRLFGSPSETAWANHELFLIAYKEELIQRVKDTLDMTVTDENGYFKMEYEEFTKNQGEYNPDGSDAGGFGHIQLVNGPVIARGPFNVNVNRVFNYNPQIYIQVKFDLIEPVGLGDSLYVTSYNILESDLYSLIVEGTNYTAVFAGPIQSGESRLVKIGTSDFFPDALSDRYFKWGRTMEEASATDFVGFDLKLWPDTNSIVLSF